MLFTDNTRKEKWISGIERCMINQIASFVQSNRTCMNILYQDIQQICRQKFQHSALEEGVAPHLMSESM